MEVSKAAELAAKRCTCSSGCTCPPHLGKPKLDYNAQATKPLEMPEETFKDFCDMEKMHKGCQEQAAKEAQTTKAR